jgi:hypothetical protein
MPHRCSLACSYTLVWMQSLPHSLFGDLSQRTHHIRFLWTGSLSEGPRCHTWSHTMQSWPFAHSPTSVHWLDSAFLPGHPLQTRKRQIMISQYLACEGNHRPSVSPLVAIGCQILLRYKKVLSCHGYLFSRAYQVLRGKSFHSPSRYSHANNWCIGVMSRAGTFMRSHLESHELCDLASRSFWRFWPGLLA